MVEQSESKCLEKKTSFRYSTKKLGEKFLRESFFGDFSLYNHSQRQTTINLKGILDKKFPGQSEFTETDRNQIVKEISEGKLTFGYLAFMLHEEHPMVRNWPEKDKRSALDDILENEISGFKKHITEIKTGRPIRYGDTSTVESVKKEMIPYQNLKNKLFKK
jgi:hypothetical protein